MCRFVLFACALLAISAVQLSAEPPAASRSSRELQPKTRVEVLRRIQGGFSVDGREKRLPRDGFIADERAWGVLWQTLTDDKLLPAVDFEHEIVLMVFISDENDLSLDATTDDQGNVRVMAMATCVGYVNPTHGSYLMYVVRREGIKTVNEKPVRKGIWRQVNPLRNLK